MTGSERGQGVGVCREVVEFVGVRIECVEDVDVVDVGELSEGYFTSG
jgi:hypothetical protein